MGGLFGGKPKKAKPPPLPAPQAIPVVEPAAEDLAMQKYRGRKGFTKTIITGELEPNTDKKKVLG